MTVTLARQTPGGQDGGSGRSGIRRTISCKPCGTEYVIDIEPPERIRIEVAGPTCRDCNPRPPHPAPEPSPAGRASSPVVVGRDVKLVWRMTGDSGPVLEVIRIDTSRPAVERAADRRRVEPPAPAAKRPGGTTAADPDGTLREEAADAIDATLGDTAGALIRQAWRPEYCRLVAAQADALRTVMASGDADSIDGLRIAIRLLDAPPLVAAFTVEVFARLLEYQEHNGRLERPIWELTYELEAWAMVVCCGTSHLGDCATAARVAVSWGEDELTPELVTRIGRSFVALRAAPAGLASFEVTMEALSSRGDTLQVGAIDIPAGSPLAGVDRIAAEVIECEGAFPRGRIAFGDAG
jgi:hypothetical protein